VYVQSKNEVRSRNVYTSSAILTAWLIPVHSRRAICREYCRRQEWKVVRLLYFCLNLTKSGFFARTFIKAPYIRFHRNLSSGNRADTGWRTNIRKLTGALCQTRLKMCVIRDNFSNGQLLSERTSTDFLHLFLYIFHVAWDFIWGMFATIQTFTCFLGSNEKGNKIHRNTVNYCFIWVWNQVSS
jgi:hypothetical protein